MLWLTRPYGCEVHTGARINGMGGAVWASQGSADQGPDNVAHEADLDPPGWGLGSVEVKVCCAWPGPDGGVRKLS